MSEFNRASVSDQTQSALAILSDLIAFDTTSRESNLALIDYVHDYLSRFGIAVDKILSPDGNKSNLLGTIGPQLDGGIVLSGHTDVVPVDGQTWHSDPFRLTDAGTTLIGRGVADMKTFLAVSMAAAPMFARTNYLRRPVHLAFSYDEEVGCLGAPRMIQEMLSGGLRPAAVIVGEPTEMKIVGTHKGVTSYEVVVTGHEAHSSLPHLGLSANMAAVSLMGSLVELAKELECDGSADPSFTPSHSTLTIGKIEGGTAINILSGRCAFSFDLRSLPGADPDEIMRPFLTEIDRCDKDMAARFPGTGVVANRRVSVPAFGMDEHSEAIALVRRLTGDNSMPRAVAFGSEAGQFQQAGFASVICGPGSIEQAHQPDEFIAKDQVSRCIAFMGHLAEHLASS